MKKYFELWIKERGKALALVNVYHFVARRKVHPNLKELNGVAACLVQEGEHFRVGNALASRHPLHVALSEAASCAEGVRVVDKP